MKKLFLLLIALFIIFYSLKHTEEKPIHGVMIDCSRLLEKHEYYYRLIDFMHDWEMNTLLLHFSDDHGLSIQIPGYKDLAQAHAFTPEEIHDLVFYAKRKNIEIIPELEVFGHTRYISDHPQYRDLFVGERNDKIVFNALDPQNPKTLLLMKDMVKQVSALFPSHYFHLGCDEVNLKGLGLNENEENELWVNYVNKMIASVHELGKTPMIWNDHVNKNIDIAKRLNKNVLLVEWNYNPDYVPTQLDTLKKMGFNKMIMAPSISCWRNRVIPVAPQLKNVNAHAQALREGKADGLINTVWLPMRYVQNAMWYGMAYSAYLVNENKIIDLNKFHKTFVRKTFGVKLYDALNDFLIQWTQLHLDRRFYIAISSGDLSLLNEPEKIKELEHVYHLSNTLLQHTDKLAVNKNSDILESMILSAEIMNTLSEGLLFIAENDFHSDKQSAWEIRMSSVIQKVDREWDEGRYADDPAKYQAKFSNQESSHILIVLRKLYDLTQDH